MAMEQHNKVYVVSGQHQGLNGSMLNGSGAALNGSGGGDHNTTVDDHFEFFKTVCNRANDYFLFRLAKGTYSTTKHSFGFLEQTLDKVEGQVVNAAHFSAPIYEHYLFPATDRLVGYYNRSVEKSKFAVDRTKSAAVTTGTLGLGLALVATQMGLIAGTAATNLFLDGVIKTKNAGGAVINKGISVEKAMEQQVHNAIQATQQLAKNPVEKMNEHANTFLDIANTVFERLLNLPMVTENPESSLRERVSHLAHRVAQGVSNSANTVIEPCQRQLNVVLEQLAKSLILVDYLKKQQEWSFKKVNQLSASVLEWRTKIESEAVQACTTPENALLSCIRASSSKLNEQLPKLRVSASEILNESMINYLESFTAYVEQLGHNFTNAEDIYQVKDEVVDEAKLKLNDFTQWSSSLLNGRGVSKAQSKQNANSY